MKNILAIIFVAILSISLVSAITITAGESVELTLSEEYSYYSIVGNTTEVDLEVEQVGLNITITASKYMKEDTFEIIFFNKEKEVVTVYTGGGGSSSSCDNCEEDDCENLIKYVEVDNYIDRPVNDTTIGMDGTEEPKRKLSSLGIITLVLFSVALIVGSIIILRRKE